jgi:hypothetical protein
MTSPERFAAELSGLTPIEVFDFYDGPRFYSCRDRSGQLFLVYWVDEDEGGSHYLYLKVSPERYASVRRGTLTIASALANPEEGKAYVVRKAGTGYAVEALTPALLDPEWLPPQDQRLALETSDLPPKLSSALDVAVASGRQVLDVALVKTSNAYEIGAGKLGRLLDAIQNTLFAFACPANKDIRKVPDEIKFNNEALVTGVFASSFGLRLQSKSAEMFADSQAVFAMRSLSDLLHATSRPEELAADLHRQNILGRSRFKHLLRTLLEAQVALNLDWATPSGERRSVRATYHDLAVALQRLEATDEVASQTVQRAGRLVGVDVQSNFFALRISSDEVLKGTLAPELQQNHFEVPSEIVATLHETCVVDPLTEREKWSYVLHAAVKREA